MFQQIDFGKRIKEFRTQMGHGFLMAKNGAQEMEIFDTSGHKTGYAYMPVMRC